MNLLNHMLQRKREYVSPAPLSTFSYLSITRTVIIQIQTLPTFFIRVDSAFKFQFMVSDSVPDLQGGCPHCVWGAPKMRFGVPTNCLVWRAPAVCLGLLEACLEGTRSTFRSTYRGVWFGEYL